MEQEPKISITEIVYITPLFILFDSIGIALLIFGLDDFFLLDIIRFPVSQIYLRMKGVKGMTTLVGNILESIPYVGALPISTACWLITVYLDRNPEGIAAKGVEIAGRMKFVERHMEEKKALGMMTDRELKSSEERERKYLKETESPKETPSNITNESIATPQETTTTI